MSAGFLYLKLHLPDNFSLKDKRRLLHSLISQVRQRFNVSITEVEDQDQWQITTLGIACVASNGRFVEKTLSRVRDFILSNRFEVEVIDQEMETLGGP